MPRILIVDDEKENRESLKLILGDENPEWEILTAAGESEGINLVATKLTSNEPVDVILTDLVMDTEQSGMNLIREARKLDPFIMVILFTAKEKNLDRYGALELGAFDVVEKNIRGATAVKEINVKAHAALRYRSSSRRIAFLRRYFDPRVFDTVDRDPSVLNPSERLVTVCFWDIRGFSYLCEILKKHPDLIAGFMRNYCELAARCIFEHNGLLDKFIGDGVMALFGVLNHKNDEGKSDAASAINSALAFRSAFYELREVWIEKWSLYTAHKIEIDLGCGIHTGEALIGNMGTDFRDQFTALGENVNLASRLEGRSKDGQIVISQTTKARVGDLFDLTKLEEIENIKNIPGKFEIYTI